VLVNGGAATIMAAHSLGNPVLGLVGGAAVALAGIAAVGLLLAALISLRGGKVGPRPVGQRVSHAG
jgi:hypothetical protein